ncbi:hypothetical protein DFO66_11326 [Brevibacterium sanguinis]|uniref:Uncharacterized protein n=2 Tax=Brevibacterium TaxID=1696 RepID=A0A366IFH6_9MICO|nr:MULTISPECIES: hypothetical protein [Brevibacterium]RBP62763.1 hypothetical protein DFO66_11326 [Brevibacterium sanguinis]RBP69328.1 hypothetical protein DFO65_11326 [Brevibacterium celere]
MSHLADLIRASRPEWSIPDELDAAWAWMEHEGFGRETAAGYVLTPYPGERQLGPVFAADLTLGGWLEPDDPRADDLLPIAEISGSGGLAALWRDPAGVVRVVAFDGDGEPGILADSPTDFLALLAIGYDELTRFSLGAPPSEQEAVEAIAPFRAFVAGCGIAVPDDWAAPTADAFTVWLSTPPEAGDEPAIDYPCTGIAFAVLDLLGSPDGPDLAARFSALTGVPVSPNLESGQAALRDAGIFVFLTYGVLHTVSFNLEPHRPYAHPDRLIAGLSSTTGKAELRSWLGKPTSRRAATLRYEWGDRSLSADFQHEEIARITLDSPPPTPPAVDDESVFTGAAIDLLRMLGEPDSADLASRLGAVLGVDLGETVRKSSRRLRGVGVEVDIGKKGLRTVWAKAESFPGTLIDGIDTSTTKAQARALLGSPEAEGETHLRYFVVGRFLHLGFDDGQFSQVTLMHSRP